MLRQTLIEFKLVVLLTFTSSRMCWLLYSFIPPIKCKFLFNQVRVRTKSYKQNFKIKPFTLVLKTTQILLFIKMNKERSSTWSVINTTQLSGTPQVNSHEWCSGINQRFRALLKTWTNAKISTNLFLYENGYLKFYLSKI